MTYYSEMLDPTPACCHVWPLPPLPVCTGHWTLAQAGNIVHMVVCSVYCALCTGEEILYGVQHRAGARSALFWPIPGQAAELDGEILWLSPSYRGNGGLGGSYNTV